VYLTVENSAEEALGYMSKESSNLDDDLKPVYENKFELIAIAARRARELREGRRMTIGGGLEKEHIVALRELISGQLDVVVIRENKIKETEE